MEFPFNDRVCDLNVVVKHKVQSTNRQYLWCIHQDTPLSLKNETEFEETETSADGMWSDVHSQSLQMDCQMRPNEDHHAVIMTLEIL